MNIYVQLFYLGGTICRTLSQNIVASSIWGNNHEPVHNVPNCQNSSIMLARCAGVEKLYTRVINHTCEELKFWG